MPPARERGPLERLLKRADAVGEDAEAAIRKSLREVRAEIALLTRETDVGRSAAAREVVLDAARKRLSKLRKRLERITDAAAEYAARQGFDAGLLAAGDIARARGEKLDVHYSKERADEICALVTEGQGKSLAAVFTENMEANVMDALRSATVAAMRENAVAGGTMKDLARTLEEKWLGAAKDGETFQFIDAGGHVWDTKTYVAMNVRTNSMRVYNDSVADAATQAGCDLVMVTSGGDPDCRLCFPWEGRILSLTGKTKGFPTYEEAREAGCFHPNCVHTYDPISEAFYAEEIALQRDHPIDAKNATPEELDENRYEIDQDRYRRQGMDAEQARLAVDRDNLEASIRAGLLREDARQIVDGMTDAQVTALCPNGNPPSFEPTKKATRDNPNAADEIWRHGSRGGTVHIDRNADLAHILDVCDVAWKPRTALERSTDALMQGIGVSHTDETLGISDVNPNFGTGSEWEVNCQRCVPAYEARLRGYDVTAKPADSNRNGYRMWKDGLADRERCRGGRSFKADFERRTAHDPEGARYLLRIRWRGGDPDDAHFFMARKTSGGMVYEDPQNPLRHASRFFDRAARVGNYCLRIDNREFTGDIVDCVKPR